MPRTPNVSKELNGVAPVFGALGDRTRLGIVSRLSARGPLTTANLTSASTLSRQAVSKHLQTLADAGIVRSRRDGRDRVWALRTEGFVEARNLLAEISGQWDEALKRLKYLVEETKN